MSPRGEALGSGDGPGGEEEEKEEGCTFLSPEAAAAAAAAVVVPGGDQFADSGPDRTFGAAVS